VRPQSPEINILIEPSSPAQHADIERFNGTFGDECLNKN
jgi:hypothetical protein